MPHSAVIHARIDSETKAATERILADLGLTLTEAIRLLYRQIAMRKEFPLELRVPNALTASVLKKSENNEEIETFDSSDDLFESWDK
ncbi:MAG: type II toxin-antitoxin system RelB/DinJ family antitoxin [Proteobacteria bacterium]|nr:type II toxin-antitoxin system RelB/DinJ family antitoxin [Pseudomonadota bacterium]